MNSILKTILKRLAWSLVVLLGLSIVIFILMRVMPGDIARLALGASATDEAVEAYRQTHHLYESMPVQYWYWLMDVFRFDFGVSTLTHRAVVGDLKDFLPATLELVLWASVLPIFAALGLGILGAIYKNKWPDYLIRFSSYIIIATPAFVWAALFLLVFGYWLDVLPSIGGRISAIFTVPHLTGFTILDSLLDGQWDAAWDATLHIIFPALALSLSHIMQEARLTRSYMLENMGKDYITMMASQGVPRGLISRKFLLKPSVIPTVSIMGLDIAAIFGNAFLVETIFNWPGLSRYCLSAIMAKDVNAVCACVLVLGLVFVTVNIIVDIVVTILDPRMRQKRSK